MQRLQLQIINFSVDKNLYYKNDIFATRIDKRIY